MSKFKVGDKVVATAGPGFIQLLQYTQGVKDYYTVTRTGDGGYWLQLDGMQRHCDPVPWCVEYFELYQEPDDELPPVPDSVMYFNSVRDEGNDQHLVLERTDRSDAWHDEATAHIGLKIAPRTGSKRAAEAIGINLTPDAALQLAHDLRRMAMKIKREQR